jgi:hypothetical protein
VNPWDTELVRRIGGCQCHGMERLQIVVERVIERGLGKPCVAHCAAISRERFARRPRARIELTLVLEPRRTGESTRALHERVRDEALRYLDVE